MGPARSIEALPALKSPHVRLGATSFTGPGDTGTASALNAPA